MEGLKGSMKLGPVRDEGYRRKKEAFRWSLRAIKLCDTSLLISDFDDVMSTTTGVQDQIEVVGWIGTQIEVLKWRRMVSGDHIPPYASSSSYIVSGLVWFVTPSLRVVSPSKKPYCTGVSLPATAYMFSGTVTSWAGGDAEVG